LLAAGGLYYLVPRRKRGFNRFHNQGVAMTKRRPYSLTGTPRLNGGARVVPAAELVRMIQFNPALQRGIAAVNAFEKSPRQIQMLMHKTDKETDKIERINRLHVHAGLLKQRGILG
jgi:hypothetical protein